LTLEELTKALVASAELKFLEKNCWADVGHKKCFLGDHELLK
jgi:hypothetical protein